MCPSLTSGLLEAELVQMRAAQSELQIRTAAVASAAGVPKAVPEVTAEDVDDETARRLSSVMDPLAAYTQARQAFAQAENARSVADVSVKVAVDGARLLLEFVSAADLYTDFIILWKMYRQHHMVRFAAAPPPSISNVCGVECPRLPCLSLFPSSLFFFASSCASSTVLHRVHARLTCTFRPQM